MALYLVLAALGAGVVRVLTVASSASLLPG
jgi:hypothetical protein